MKSVFLEHVQQLSDAISRGAIASGARLPTHRDYAYQHKIAPGTVARIYAELVRQGLATGEVGRGTFARLPEITPRDIGTGLNEEGAPRSDVIDLTLNYPVLTDQTDRLRDALRFLAEDPKAARYLAYQPHGGALEDREQIAAYAQSSGLGAVEPDSIVLTQGGQHGIALALMSLLKPGSRVACESLTYPGFKIAAEQFGIELIPVICDSQGIDPADLHQVCLEHKVKALYCMPTVQNPRGYTMPEERRLEILRVAEQHGLIVLEDSAYSFLDENAPPPMAQLAPEHVVYIDSFSKIIAPGLRAGYLSTANHKWAALLARGVRVTTWSAMPFAMGLVARWLNDGTVERWAGHKRQHARRLQQLVRSQLPSMMEVEAHPSAFHSLLHLTNPWRADDFTVALAREGVAVSPARAFAVVRAGRPSPPEAVRIAFGGVSDVDLRTALVRLRRRWEDPFSISTVS
ncbi:GntR family transcriptional regulator [Burkholderia lata]|uniref:GntR family transcriptional regulator n=1 Tax=Burkholderia lata (strain ATCC 17760 / DSM 23089 / LMG 22485 / NCIMB 9086 / R18194 / 383) TaxID=482957 RepID=A0A6P2V071_BURL3|nr:PLP-dependent aminotransferase family protein [Burkholderia lata]VWC76454.1 GntR family transcriptional regulator [Burkholderia lata]